MELKWILQNFSWTLMKSGIGNLQMKGKQGLLGCSKDVAQVMVEKMYNDMSVNRDWIQEEERGEATVQNDDNKNSKQVGADGEQEEVSLVNQICLWWF